MLTKKMEPFTGTESPPVAKKSLYEKHGVAVCSQNKALVITAAVFITIFAVSIIIAYTGPQSECSCAGEKPSNFQVEEYDSSKPFVPIATNGQVFPWNNIRLPHFIRPFRYNITIRPNLTTLEVKGQVNIEFQVDKDTNYIVFHSSQLTITDKLLQDRKGPIKIANLLEYPPAEQMYLEVKEKFRKRENYTLSLRYTTTLQKLPRGFYLSSYTAPDGVPRFLATTNFEPTYARSAFPCFDEPHLKARFKISIFRDRFHIALCNMPVLNTEDTGFYMGTGLLRDVFQESVEMSTFLVAFVVCDYSFVTSKSENEVPVAVYAPRTLLNQTHFAMEIATKTIDFFEDFFMVSYPLPKQDLIAIPDFTTGAMDNWGLITYRGNGLLYENLDTTALDHQSIAIAVTHELAHQWFGNLVTIRWWNDLWLHEGLCRFLEYLAVDNIYPEWGTIEQFILDKTQSALQLDSLANSHPVAVQINKPADIETYFDSMTYNKAASILNMLDQFLSRETFRYGLRDFLNQYRYGNAESKELWTVMTQNTNYTMEVKTIMDTWTLQMGYPLIRVARNENVISITQERFLLSAEWNETRSNYTVKSIFDYKWYVPLSYFTNLDPEEQHTLWLNSTDGKLEIAPEVKWIKFNIKQTGFYRTMYDDSLWMKLIETLYENHTAFSAADRANLIDDVFSLSRAGLINASVPLKLSLYLTKEREYAPWKTAVNHLQTWSRFLTESAAYKLFMQYIRQLIQPVTEYVGWIDTGSHIMKLLRSNILSLAILSDVESTVKEARTRFNKWMTDQYKISPNLKEIIYSAGIKHGGLQEWQHCWKEYNQSKTTKERLALMNALGATSDPWLLQRYLLTSLNRDMVNVQDVKVVLSSVATNPKGQLLAWRHLKAYWSDIHTLFGNESQALGNLISTVTSYLSTPYDYQEVMSYFEKIDIGPAKIALNQSLEMIRLNIQWMNHNENDISNWLKQNQI
ncbi:endoplasmic reticulum aminopeptidase 1-like isoform X2 [Chrysoperla carnea]|uniref:endoplasmic reticulum aminopeptidase 1-like isoform X2 n=1 Tax=Chrysoperla carnea TaxID=189513 RepID=UPI001D06D9D3|nr:endoplasmic reticulum aminopeptidase 1-like isoform X2 [Chrysoperla carnea]